MTQEKQTPTTLSLNLRKMKFMQRGMTEEERQALEESNSKLITREHWELDLPPMEKADNEFEVVDSVSKCVKLKHGRMSFGGFNKAIEKLMYEMDRENLSEEEESGESEADVSDEEMAERYSSLIGTIAKKYSGKKSSTENGLERKGRKPDGSEDMVEVPAKIQRTSTNNKRFLKPSD